MRLRATIMIDIDADDFVEAAVHQEKVEEIHSLVRQQYEQAQLDIRHRRRRSPASSRVAYQLRSGRASAYEE